MDKTNKIDDDIEKVLIEFKEKYPCISERPIEMQGSPISVFINKMKEISKNKF